MYYTTTIYCITIWVFIRISVRHAFEVKKLIFKIMINDREKRMEQRRKEYQQDKLVYSAIGTILKIGIVVWILGAIVTTVVVEFIEN